MTTPAPIAPSVELPPIGSNSSFAPPKPIASSTTTIARMIRAPRRRMSLLAPCAGEMSPMRRRMNSWRLDGACWPSFSTAAFRSSGRRSASASEASAIRRSCMRSCGRAAAIALRKCSRAVCAS